MGYVSDLHIHSRFSRACSPKLNVPNLVSWAKLKGIDVLGTGDFLHPLWLNELKAELKDDGNGFLAHNSSEIKFVLTVEIASIYTHKGKGRRVHNLVFMPDFQAAERFQKELLSRKTNLGSDGRPIVGISSKDLLSLALQASEKAIFIPAHAWTPWFGVFGSESGYDRLEDCFEDLTKYVYGIETGLSSDPAMNWRIKELDNKSILSFSDAHSLPNLGRETTVFDGELALGYSGMFDSIKNQKILETIEFYPEEGKYHFTGHRTCKIKYTPEDTKARGTTCPVCKKGLTVGVMERVEAIATRSNGELRTGALLGDADGIIKSKAFTSRAGYRMLVPLLTVLAEAFNTVPTNQKVINEYNKLTSILGDEIKILIKVLIDDIAKVSGEKIAEGVRRDRIGDLVIDPGYDGVYGVVKIWNDEKKKLNKEIEIPQLELFN